MAKVLNIRYRRFFNHVYTPQWGNDKSAMKGCLFDVDLHSTFSVGRLMLDVHLYLNPVTST